jgi:hypothetical protein
MLNPSIWFSQRSVGQFKLSPLCSCLLLLLCASCCVGCLLLGCLFSIESDNGKPTATENNGASIFDDSANLIASYLYSVGSSPLLEADFRRFCVASNRRAGFIFLFDRCIVPLFHAASWSKPVCDRFVPLRCAEASPLLDADF